MAFNLTASNCQILPCCFYATLGFSLEKYLALLRHLKYSVITRLASEIEKDRKMKTFKWVVEFEVSENLVADGFVIDNFNAKEMLASALPHAYNTEFKADVIDAPHEKEIRKVQGYK